MATSKKRSNDRIYAIRGAATHRKRAKGGSHDGGGNTASFHPATLLAYCPECPRVSNIDPEQNVRVHSPQRNRMATCPAGHKFLVR